MPKGLPQTEEELELTQDISEFWDDPFGFVMYAYHWGEGDLEKETGPDAWQADILHQIGESIRKDPKAPIRIAVASGHGIGKTALVAWINQWRISTGPQCRGVITANSKPQLDTKTWAEMALWHKRLINRHWFKWTATKFFHVAHPETWFISAAPNTEHNSEAFAGLHSPFNITTYDEASAVGTPIWEVTEGTMTDDGAIHIVFGNPTRNTGAFRECFRDQKHRWITRQIDSRSAKRTNKEALAEMIETYGEDSDFCRVRILGQFPRAGSMQFIDSDTVNFCMAYDAPYEAYYHMPIILGVDVARYGEDQTVFVVRQGRKILEMQREREWDTMQTVAQAAFYIRRYNPPVTFVDEVGVGSGVVDRLRQLGYSVVGVNAGRKPYEEKVYFNKRAEMWDRMRRWLQEGADIPDNERELKKELIAVQYGFSDAKTGELLRLERKKDMKDREGFSPDGADALSMTFAEELGDITHNYFEPDDQFEPDI